MTDLFAFGLILARVSGFAFSAPFISEHHIPPQFRVLGSIFVSLGLLSTVTIGVDVSSWERFFWLAPVELGIGIVLGFGMGLVFSAIRSAGAQIGNIAGLRFHTGGGMDVDRIGLGELLFIFSAFLMIATGGDKFMIKAFIHFYNDVPIGAFSKGILPLNPIYTFGTAFFMAVVKLSLPIVCAMALFYFLAGVFEHFFPNWDLFSMVFPGAVLLGLWCLFLFAPQLLNTFNILFLDGIKLVQEAL